MVILAPSLLSANFANLKEEVQKAEDAGLEILHLDIMDGSFVPNITFGAGLIKDLRSVTKMLFDVHLMIKEPERHIDDFVAAGADYITVHVEATTHLHRVLDDIRKQGVKAGVALNPSTPLSAIEWVLPQLDLILLMTVNPGFGGQALIEEVLPKIQAMKSILKEKKLEIPIQVDGGINKDTAPKAVHAGADILVAGSAIFGKPDIEFAAKEIIESLK